jgi:hypothetical protein
MYQHGAYLINAFTNLEQVFFYLSSYNHLFSILSYILLYILFFRFTRQTAWSGEHGEPRPAGHDHGHDTFSHEFTPNSVNSHDNHIFLILIVK